MELDERKKIVGICQSLINNDINLVEGCRRLVSLRYQFDLEDDPDFLPFVGVASETDDYPELNIRDNFSEDYLKRVDEEISDYINLARPSIIDACHVLVSKYRV